MKISANAITALAAIGIAFPMHSVAQQWPVQKYAKVIKAANITVQ